MRYGAELASHTGYKYFGAAKDLPGVSCHLTDQNKVGMLGPRLVALLPTHRRWHRHVENLENIVTGGIYWAPGAGLEKLIVEK